MTFLFNEFLHKPIFNLLVFLYNAIPGSDFGVAIIVLTLMVRIVFWPFSIKAVSSQKKLSELQPRIKEIQDKFKHNKTVQAQAIMELYKKENINPMSGCLPLIVQIPVLLALYKALADGFDPAKLSNLYSFVANPQIINNISLGFLDLAVKSPMLAIIAGAAQFIQSKISVGFQTAVSKNAQSMGSSASMMNKQMLYFFPFMIIIIGWNLPAGLILYWIVTTAFSILEQLYIKRKRV